VGQCVGMLAALMQVTASQSMAAAGLWEVPSGEYRLLLFGAQDAEGARIRVAQQPAG
jgi:ABC-type cobalt transport system substrate-binding protein